ncbi:MAG: hypothetical protein NTY16_09260, partial [Deltaproteobacteria bacterium]|nr:hypothetical protein [Deltaproteobacteria bacterium]
MGLILLSSDFHMLRSRRMRIPDRARKAFDDYRSYLKAEGQGVNVAETPGRISLASVDPLYGGVFVEQSGRYLIGAVRVKEISAAKQLVEQLRKRLIKR